MSSVSIYLNFQGNTEEAFNFYKSLFKTEFEGPLARMKDVPPMPGMPPLPDNEKNAVMHVSLPIFSLWPMDSSICLEPDSKEETDRLFNALSAGGSDIMPLQDMFWGAYWGTCLDKFGIRWMFNFQKK